ncbi:MAG: type II restriction endonuclease [Spirochaetaceae bacterium]|nr:type II restriction endonuclease [Spirochaetaceae bacterium]
MQINEKVTIEKAWKMLFEKHDIVSKVLVNGFFKIKASEINIVKEARLMAKFDQSTQLPEVFQHYNLSILPISRSEYIIGNFNTYEKVLYQKSKPKMVSIPILETLDHTNLYSEASALLFAYNSGIIKDVMNSKDIHYTVSGRMSSGCFDYIINSNDSSQKIEVQNAQVEIDGGYEFDNGFCIIEAKNIAVDEILIRQLYYPYRLWTEKISKQVIPVLMVYSNDIFHFFQYNFTEISNYNSLKLVSYKSYTFANELITLEEIIDVWKNTKYFIEPKTSFPQANFFGRIIDLLSILYEQELTREEVTIQYEFDLRQTDYYIAACVYLGLVERMNINGESGCKLSPEAKHIMSLNFKQKNLLLIRKIFERPIFYKAFGLIIQNNKIPDKHEICYIMNKSNLSINPTTIDRRASTVKSWLDWILRVANTEECDE